MYSFEANNQIIKVDDIWREHIEKFDKWTTQRHRCRQKETLLIFPVGFRHLNLHKTIYPGAGVFYSIQFLNGDYSDLTNDNIQIVPYKKSFKKEWIQDFKPTQHYVELSEALIESTEFRHRAIECAICSVYRYEEKYRNCLFHAADLYLTGWKCVDCEVKRLLVEYGVIK